MQPKQPTYFVKENMLDRFVDTIISAKILSQEGLKELHKDITGCTRADRKAVVL